MEPTPDELAGVVELFGGLTRAELAEGLAELAYKRGEDYDPEAFESAIEGAIESYHLVAVDRDGGDLLVVGPVAFPQLPADAEDLPHILDVPERTTDQRAATEAAAARFRADAERAREAGDTDRMETLLDVSYELEAWASLDLGAVRDELSAELNR